MLLLKKKKRYNGHQYCDVNENNFTFLFQDAHDAILERLREEKLHAVVLVIQRTVRVYRDRWRTLAQTG